MIDKCNGCGQCCSHTHVGEQTHIKVQSNINLKGTDKFISENWIFQNKIEMKFGAPFYIYSCKLLTKENRCSDYENRPYICSGYPYYESEDFNIWDNQPWDYVGCGYEMDHWRARLIRNLEWIMEDKELI